MLFRHATPRKNLSSILRQGLLCSKSKGRMKAVWLHSPGKTAWALLHVVKRHGGRVEDVVVFEVNVPRSWLRRSPRCGLWYVRQDIPPARLRRLLHFDELATSQSAAWRARTMRATIFHAVPAFRCHCPAKAFHKARQALRYARRAAAVFRVEYAVWRVRNGTLRLLKRFPAAHVRPRS